VRQQEQANFGTKSNFKDDVLMPHGPFFYAYGVSMQRLIAWRIRNVANEQADLPCF
jgi:hypothetical protein